MKARVVPDVIWRRPSFLFGSFVNFGIVYKSSYLLIVNILNIQRQTYLRRKFTEQNLLLQQIQHWITSIQVYKLDPSVSIIDGTKCLETVINPTAWCRETGVDKPTSLIDFIIIVLRRLFIHSRRSWSVTSWRIQLSKASTF